MVTREKITIYTSPRSLSEDIAASSSDSLIDSKIVKSLTMSSNSSCATSKTRSYLDVIPVKVNNNGKSICTYALLDTGSERTFCEQRLVDEMNPCNSHVKLAIQTLSTGYPHILDTIAVSFSISSLDDSYSMNLADVVVVESIPVAPTVMPNLGDLQRHSHLSDVSFTKVKGGSVTLLIGNDHAAAHRCLESRFSPSPKTSPDALLTNFGWLLRGTQLVNENDPSAKENPSANFLVRGYQWPEEVHD